MKLNPFFQKCADLKHYDLKDKVDKHTLFCQSVFRSCFLVWCFEIGAFLREIKVNQVAIFMALPTLTSLTLADTSVLLFPKFAVVFLLYSVQPFQPSSRTARNVCSPVGQTDAISPETAVCMHTVHLKCKTNQL